MCALFSTLCPDMMLNTWWATLWRVNKTSYQAGRGRPMWVCFSKMEENPTNLEHAWPLKVSEGQPSKQANSLLIWASSNNHFITNKTEWKQDLLVFAACSKKEKSEMIANWPECLKSRHCKNLTLRTVKERQPFIVINISKWKCKAKVLCDLRSGW